MFQGFETFQKTAKETLELATKSLGTTAQSVQSIVAETVEYAKKSAEHGASTVETLVGVQSVEKVLELQADYTKKALEGFVSYATKVTEMVGAATKEAIKPVEAVVAKVSK